MASNDKPAGASTAKGTSKRMRPPTRNGILKGIRGVTSVIRGDQPGIDRSASTPATLIEAASMALESDIQRGVFPPNASLRIDALKQRYDVSASTMREALTRLTATGIVKMEGQRGFRVPPISMSDFTEIASVRILVEAAALRKAIELGDDEWEASIVSAYFRLQKVEKRLASLDIGTIIDDDAKAEWGILHRQFHFSLFQSCGSKWMHHFLSIIYDQSRRYRVTFFPFNTEGRKNVVIGEHKRLVDAVLARDADLAVKHLISHIENNRAIVLAIMKAGKIGSDT